MKAAYTPSSSPALRPAVTKQPGNAIVPADTSPFR
nr:MAG TPA: hypothetical protein [Caudoviricetes sp.]